MNMCKFILLQTTWKKGAMSLQRGTWYKASCCHLLEPHLQWARPESRDSSDQASPRMSASPGTWELSEGLCRRHTVSPPRGV